MSLIEVKEERSEIGVGLGKFVNWDQFLVDNGTWYVPKANQWNEKGIAIPACKLKVRAAVMCVNACISRTYVTWGLPHRYSIFY